MASDVENAGRLVTEYATTARRLASLRVEARRMRVLLDAASASLDSAHSEWLIAPDAWPSAHDIDAVLRDMRSSRAQLAEVAGHLRALGLPVEEAS